MTAAIEIVDVSKTFGGGRDLLLRRRPAVQAVRGVSLDVRAGETLGVVGESGSGKTTLARMLVGLDRPSAGAVRIDGRDSAELARGDPHELARRVQYVFQDPVAALNPRKTVRQAIEAPLRRLAGLDGAALAARRDALMSAVGLAPALADRHPHALSGGQAQRVGIARALAADAGVLVLDEPVSALDVSVQAQVLNLLARLREEQGLTYVFISHDLAVVESLCDRIAVMYFGRIVEIAPARDLFRRPRHPYTDLLRASTPSIGKAAAPASAALAEAPDPRSPPPGCAFAPRCPRAVDRCRAEAPDLDSGAGVACWRPLEPPP